MKADFDGEYVILSGAHEDLHDKDRGTVSFDKTLEAGIASALRSISLSTNGSKYPGIPPTKIYYSQHPTMNWNFHAGRKHQLHQ
jgi:hypothetical protein